MSLSRAPLSVLRQSTAACKPVDAPVLPGEALREACEVRLSTRVRVYVWERVCTCVYGCVCARVRVCVDQRLET